MKAGRARIFSSWCARRSWRAIWPLALTLSVGARTMHAEPAPAVPPGYRLVWADEFEADGPPDPAKWTFEQGFARNKELQWYQAENARCAGGRLIIEARRESRPNPRHEPGSRDWRRSRPTVDYTSASVTTRGLHAWLYGRIEVRAKIDVRAGMWPAIWTLGVENRWPANGEIDVMEYYSGKVLANTFWAQEGRNQPAGVVVKKSLEELSGPQWAEDFHVWRLDWDAAEIRIYVDDVLWHRTPIAEAQRFKPEQAHPFQQPHYLILNLAVGANGGDPSAAEFPARFEVDYVRVYQRTD
ncbi:MAG: glycoside hydrolase family 16 protein [Candidatus Didemnitutus sp.]|nr:glycoside hydrolase family 16 protein [Candidatus Didemnitutus sp.]